MEQLIIGVLMAFAISFYAIPIVLKVVKQKNLFDIPDDDRKVHSEPTPSLGGVAIFAGFIVSFLLTVVPNPFELSASTAVLDKNYFYIPYYILAFLTIFFIGLKDDLITISPLKKFIGQLAIAFLLSLKTDLLITGMHGFLGLGTLDIIASYAFTFFTVILIINAFNLIDGIDGLAGSIGCVSSLTFGLYFFINGEIIHALLGIVFAASLLGFLMYNYHPARIFMGDTGSMMIGLVNAILVIRFIEGAPGYSVFAIEQSPSMSFGILLLPLMDTLRVFSIRIFHLRSPFSADRNHLHHILLDKGISHTMITLLLTFISILFIALSFAMRTVNSTITIAVMGVLFFAIIGALMLTKKRSKMRILKIVRPIGRKPLNTDANNPVINNPSREVVAE